jgi:putative ABC transport system permease protein
MPLRRAALRIALRLVALAAAVAPAGCRADFRHEWTAEIVWSEREMARRRSAGPRGVAVARRALGAFVHALWLRTEQWSLEMLWQDLRHAVRLLVGQRSFTLVAVATLAVGIGANTAIFSLVYGVLLKPLPFRDPDRLVQIWETNPLRNWTDATASPANLLDWRARNRVFEEIAFYPGMDDRTPMLANGTLASAEGAERIRGLQVSTNFFRVLGADAFAGRTFTDDEQQSGRHRVAVLSHGLWSARFNRDPLIVGRDIVLNTVPYRVVGVMPREFRFPSRDVDAWVPFVMTPQTAALRRPHYLRPIARLKPGVTPAQARAEMTAIAAALEREYPDTNTQMGVGLKPLLDWVVGDARTPLLVFLGAVALVLLVACANLANLLLARAAGRRREFAVRAALGGAGWRLARQMLTESAVLAACGGLLGIVLARWGLGLVVAAGPADVPRLDEVAMDGRMLAFVAVVTSLTALLFGLAPAWHAAHADMAWLRDGFRSVGGSRTARRALVIAQIAASVALVITAGLLLRSFERLQSVPPGFDPEQAVSLRIELPGAKYGSDDAKAVAFFEALMARLRAMPGVVAAGASTVIGLDGQGWTGDLYIEGKPEVWGRELRHKEVTPGYFDAMGLRLLEGRDFADSDGPEAPRVVVVNEALARAYFGDEDPLGRRIAFRRAAPGQPAAPWWTIVGVAQDEKQNALDEPVAPEVYETHRQNSSLGFTIVVRSSTPATSLVPAARVALSEMDPGVAMFDVRPLRDVVTASMARERFTTWIVALFAGLALAIAAIGIYGVVAHAVSGRTREIGVRVALGATRRDVIGLVLVEALTLVGAGLAAGLVLCIASTRMIRTLLFQTAPTDVVTYVTVVGLLAAVALLASWVPLRRALSVDPNVALRWE